MRRWYVLILMVWLGCTSLFVSCTPGTGGESLQGIDFSLVARYGWGGRYVIRWDTPVVEVYDTTGYPRLAEVLDRWNEVHGQWLQFRLSDRSSSPLRVSYDPSLARDGYCGLAAVWRDMGNRILRAEVRINPEPGCQDQFLVFLHEFGHAAGFRGHTAEGSVMDAPVASEVITDTIVRFFRSLGRLGPGEVLHSATLPTVVEIDGLWQGRKTSASIPETLVSFYLDQAGSQVEGTFEIVGGLSGTVTGKQDGEVFLFELRPSDSPFLQPLIGLASFFEGTMLFSFSGWDGQAEHPDGLGRLEKIQVENRSIFLGEK